jgi:hypothetical protein
MHVDPIDDDVVGRGRGGVLAERDQRFEAQVG